MENDSCIHALFSAIDSKNTLGFTSLLASDCVFRFGNLVAINGIEAIGEFVDNFFASIQTINHALVEHWAIDKSIICHGTVHYLRHNNSSLTVPFANILTMDNGKIGRYLIFVDTSELFSR